MRLHEVLTTSDGDLPSEYRPYPNLVFCSNSFVNGLIPIASGNEYLVLVGQGPSPLVWLKQLVSQSGTLQFRQAVVANRPNPLFDALKVHTDNKSKRTIVEVADLTVLEAVQSSTDTAEVTKLDLHPLGILVRGNVAGLSIGTNDFSHNVFSNARVMLSLARPLRKAQAEGETQEGGAS